MIAHHKRVILILSLALVLCLGYLIYDKIIVRDDHYYVRVFDGFFPFPSEYYLFIADSLEEDRPKFNFRMPVGNPREGVIEGFFSFIFGRGGYIIIEPLAGKEPLSESFHLISEENLYGLTVRRYSFEDAVRNPQVKQMRWVAIQDDETVLSILDPDNDTWRELLDIYGSFNGIPLDVESTAAE